MTTVEHSQRSVFNAGFDTDFDRLMTEALGVAEWLDEAVDAVAVAMVEVASRLAAEPGGAPRDSSVVDLEARVRELAAERRTTRPGSAFLDRHLTAAQDPVRGPLAELADALDDLDLEPGDVVDTSQGPVVPRRLALRDAIASLVS